MEAQEHWVVQLNRRNRTAFFALLIPVLGTHLAFIHAGLLEWILLALQFLLYPQLVYWRARRSADPLRAEMQNLLVDDVLLGIWGASWGFALWITFILFIGICLNLMIFQGRRGLSKVILAMLAGVLVVGLVSGTMTALPRPGRWTVWVKRAGGVLLVGMAEFYLVKMGGVL